VKKGLGEKKKILWTKFTWLAVGREFCLGKKKADRKRKGRRRSEKGLSCGRKKRVSVPAQSGVGAPASGQLLSLKKRHFAN